MKLNRRSGLVPAQPLAPVVAKAPKVQASQDEQRVRRRKRLPVHMAGTFNLGAEVAAVCRPVAHEVSRLPRPVVLRGGVEAVADAVHDVLSTVVGMLAESRVTPDAARTRQLVADLAVRPREPGISDEQIISGTWVQTLVDYVAPYSGDLAALLGRALPPGHDGLRGNPSASERLERCLRALDVAVRDLERRVPKAAVRQALPSMAEYNQRQRERQAAARAHRALAKLGAVT